MRYAKEYASPTDIYYKVCVETRLPWTKKTISKLANLYKKFVKVSDCKDIQYLPFSQILKSDSCCQPVLKVKPVQKLTNKVASVKTDNSIALNSRSGPKFIDKNLLIETFSKVSCEARPSKSAAQKCCHELGVYLSTSNTDKITRLLRVCLEQVRNNSKLQLTI